MAYDSVEGLPDRRSEILLASLAAIMVNVNRDPKARGEPATALDFLPWMRQDDEDEPEPVDMVKRIEMLNALFGGDDRRGSVASDG